MVQMEYRTLGNTGMQLSAVGLGSWVTFGGSLDESGAVDCVKYAHDRGVNHFDTADTYERGTAERLLGAALRRLELRRSSYCVTTKLYFGVHSSALEANTLNRKYLFSGIDDSLTRLGLDHVDFLLCHRFDDKTAVEEVVRSMDMIVRSGRALHWGTSEWPAVKLMEALQFAAQSGLQPPVLEQPEYNLLRRYKVEHEFRPFVQLKQLGLVTWSPLMSGLLTGKYGDGSVDSKRAGLPGLEWLRDRLQSPNVQRKLKAIEDIARRLGMPMSDLALAWCLSNADVCSVLLGVRSVEQLAANMKAMSSVERLDAAVKKELDDAVGLVCW